MVRINAVWDRTVEVLRGRASMLGGIAFVLLFLPNLVQNAITAFFATPSAGYFAVVGLVALGLGVLSIWGNLSIVAAASDPATDRGAAMAIGASRLPTAIGLSLLMLLAVFVLMLPAFVFLGASGLPFQTFTRATQPVNVDFSGVSGGAVAGAVLYFLFVLFPVVIWLSARLCLFAPVVVNERLGLQTFGRAWRLTRGLTWRIIGIFILFGLVYAIVSGAATLVVQIVFRLLLGENGTPLATFLGGICGGAAAAAFGVVTGTFTAQLYRMVSGREAAQTFA